MREKKKLRRVRGDREREGGSFTRLKVLKRSVRYISGNVNQEKMEINTIHNKNINRHKRDLNN